MPGEGFIHVTNDEILAKIKEAFPDAVTDVPQGMKDFTIVLNVARLSEVAKFLRDDIGMDFLSSVTSVDRPERLEVVYHLFSMSRNLGPFVLKVYLSDKENAEVPSVTPLWAGASYQESEVYDLMGIRFAGHPSLRRIMLWDGFPGHPLRKDFENRTFTFKELEPTRPKPPDW